MVVIYNNVNSNNGGDDNGDDDSYLLLKNNYLQAGYCATNTLYVTFVIFISFPLFHKECTFVIEKLENTPKKVLKKQTQ